MLHVFLILCMGHVTFPTRLASISVHGLPTLLTTPPSVEGGPPSSYAANLLMSPGADCHYPDVALPLVDANLILPFYALNLNLFLIRSSSFPQTVPIVRTRFDLNPEQEWIQAYVAQTINL